MITWYVEGQRYQATLEPRAGEPVHIALKRDATGITLDLEGRSPAQDLRLGDPISGCLNQGVFAHP